MRFNKLDLNLLVALDALLAERSITLAAERLNLSPSALSNSLAKLRDYFDDDLLVQIGRKMEITPRAESLQDAVRDVLLRIDSTIVAQPAFDPSKSDRVFRIFVSDYTQLVLGPALLKLATEQHCTAQFDFLAQVVNPQRELERGDADLIIIPSGFASPDHPSETLYDEEFVCVVWSDSHLAQGELTFDRYVEAGHVVMRPSTKGESFESWFLQRFGVTRRTTVTTYSFAALPALVAGSDYIATVHARLAHRMAAAWPLTIRPAPIVIDRMDQAVQWHRYRTQDPGLVWLRKTLHRAAAHMDQMHLPPT
ncbi:LysR family transcriptional regulator [Variovorax sp. HJSM1_2]|uniref:LysR family transcriptional regulator n=1 Tax=Variovorax sp. HJSM1_2 TaxID=3366263 RepID=UPI003BC451C6